MSKKSKVKRLKASLWLTSKEERWAVLENISLLLDSGMDLLQALKAAQAEVKSKQLKKVLDEVRVEIENGVSLAESLADRRLVSEHELSLIGVGEQSSRLVANIGVLILERQKSQLFRARLSSAMLYPIFIIVVGFLVAAGLAWFVLPKLATVFVNLNVPLPKITQILIAVGEFLGKYRATVVPLSVVAAMALVYVLFFFGPTRRIGEWILFRLPGTGRVLSEVEIARFGFMMSTLVEAGLPVVDSVAAVANMSSLTGFKKIYKKLYQELETGQSFSDSFTKYGRLMRLIPQSVQQMIVAAEQSGNLQKTFSKIGERFESKTEISTKNISVILEPVLLIIVWLGVVFIAVAIMLPIYSLVGNFNNVGEQSSETVSASAEPTTGAVGPASEVGEFAAETEPQQLKVKVKDGLTGSVSVVAQPDTESDLVTKVASGEEFTVITTEGNWYQIELADGTTGYLSNSYVNEQPQ